MHHIFRWDGSHFGFIASGRLFDLACQYLAWVEPNGEVWSSEGEFIGVVDGEYISRQIVALPRLPRPPLIPPLPPLPPIPQPPRVARVLSPFTEDALVGM
jgi:hypothetical protein